MPLEIERTSSMSAPSYTCVHKYVQIRSLFKWSKSESLEKIKIWKWKKIRLWFECRLKKKTQWSCQIQIDGSSSSYAALCCLDRTTATTILLRCTINFTINLYRKQYLPNPTNIISLCFTQLTVFQTLSCLFLVVS